MEVRSSLRWRMIVDLLAVCVFGLAAPAALAFTSADRHILLVALASFLLSLAVLDGMRTRQRLGKLRAG